MSKNTLGISKKTSTVAAERNSDETWLPPWTRREHNARYEFVSRFVRDSDVIDCACGSGESSLMFLESGARSVRGFDTARESVARARATFRKPGLEYEVCDGTALPVEDSSCDVFVSLETLEHIENDRGYLSEAARVLRPGGLIICSTPNRLITNPGTAITDQPWNPFHRREYSLHEFTERLRQHFDIEGIFGQNQASHTATLLLTWLANVIGTKAVVRLRQVCKCRWFVLDATRAHAVQRHDAARCEYIVITARKPRA